MNFLVGIIIGSIGSLIAILIVIALTPIGKKFKEIWADYNKLKETGLKLFLPLNKFVLRELFKKMIDNGKVDDEILIVGRTIRWLIQKKKGYLIEGLKNGLNFKILLLNPQKVKNSKIELRPLQLKNPQTINNDLEISLREIASICDEASRQKYKGSFEVKICDYVIFNSFISCTQEKKRRIILDFSFGEDETDKYQQYYECNPQDESHFGNKLHSFYKGFYNQSDSYIHYDKQKIKHRQDLIKEDINVLIQKYSEYEKMRRNNVKNFLFIIPKLFDSIRNNELPPFPLSIQLELTNKCNTKCEHCKRYSWPNDNEMSTHRIKSLFDELAKLRVQSITLSGGEPTLREDFIDILGYAWSKGLKLGVLTNGLDINQKLADALTKYSNWVRISLDGSNPEIYQRVRGSSDGFRKVLESIKILEEAKKRNSKNYNIGICYSIQNLNIDDVAEMIGFVKELALSDREKCLTFKFVHGRNGFLCSVPQLSKFHENVLVKEDPTWNEMTNLQYLKKFMENYSSKEDITKGLPLNSYYQNNKIRCFTPYLFSLIDAFGAVYPCCFLYYDNDAYEKYESKRQRYRIGRISDEVSFENIWLSEAYMKIRNEFKIVNVNRSPECGECTRHYLHNAFFTKLFNKYDSCIEEMGNREGKIFFQQMLGQHLSEVVWL